MPAAAAWDLRAGVTPVTALALWAVSRRNAAPAGEVGRLEPRPAASPGPYPGVGCARETCPAKIRAATSRYASRTGVGTPVIITKVTANAVPPSRSAVIRRHPSIRHRLVQAHAPFMRRSRPSITSAGALLCRAYGSGPGGHDPDMASHARKSLIVRELSPTSRAARRSRRALDTMRALQRSSMAVPAP